MYETKIVIGIAMHKMFVSHVILKNIAQTGRKSLTEIHILLVKILRESYVKLKHFLWQPKSGQNITLNWRSKRTFSLITKFGVHASARVKQKLK